MKKNYLFIFCFALLSLYNTGYSQVNLYNFSQSTGTYSEITGGATVLTTGWDDEQQANVAIGFTFTFNGTAYTTVRVASNGFLVFGTTSPGGANYTPISATTAYAGAVAALGGDLINNGTSIRYETIGATPNRTFVLQWKNARRYGATAPVTGDDLNFQIRLNETTNTIDISYGTFTILTTALSYQVGLRGATNADFNNRTTTSNWAATTAGTANTATSLTNATIVPASGLTFTYTPPLPCSNPFVGGTTVSTLGSSACSGGGFTLSVTGSTSATGFTYQWETSPDGATWSPATGTSTNATYAVTGFATPTYYRRKMTCSSTDQYSTSLQVNIAAGLAYATLPYTQGFENWITNCNGITGYANGIPEAEWKNTLYTTDSSWRRNDQGHSTSAWRYVADEPSPFPAPFASTGSYSARFHSYGTEASKRGTLSLYLDCSNQTLPLQLSLDYRNPTGNDSLVVSVSTDNGVTFTRIDKLTTSSAWSNKAFVFTSTSAQTVIKFQAFSDFGNDDIGLDNLKVEVAPTCLSPTGLTITNITANAADFSWNSVVGATDYQVVVSTSATPPAGAGTSTVGATTYPFATLQTNTTYYAFVRAVCGTGVFGAWVSTQFSTTPNDECVNATLVVQEPNSTTCTGIVVSTAAATQSSQAAPACSGGFGFEDDVWYKFVAASTITTIRLSNLTTITGTVTDIGSAVYSGTCGSLTAVNAAACTAGDGTALTTDRLITGLTLGNTYYIRIYAGGVANNSASFNMCLLLPPAPPSNDDCSGATTISAASNTVNGTGAGATASTGTPTCTPTAIGTPDDDVWYSFTADYDGSATVTVVGATGYDAVIQGFSGACGSLTSLGCADATLGAGTEVLTLNGLLAGQTYYIRVYDWYSAVYGNFTIKITGSALPVALTSFTGERNGLNNVLSWKTLTEINNTGFEVQRSIDGNEFSKLSFVDSKAKNGNSSEELSYVYVDKQPFSSGSYYRLKQIDKDGKATLSKVVFIKGIKTNKFDLVSIYPNPATDKINIALSSPKTDKIILLVSDITGKIIIKQTEIVVSGDNNIKINVNNLAKGTYTVKAICADGCETAVSKFIKN